MCLLNNWVFDRSRPILVRLVATVELYIVKQHLSLHADNADWKSLRNDVTSRPFCMKSAYSGWSMCDFLDVTNRNTKRRWHHIYCWFNMCVDDDSRQQVAWVSYSIKVKFLPRPPGIVDDVCAESWLVKLFAFVCVCICVENAMQFCRVRTQCYV
jgi:hypothetical protein